MCQPYLPKLCKRKSQSLNADTHTASHMEQCVFVGKTIAIAKPTGI